MSQLHPDGTKVVLSKRRAEDTPDLKKYYVGILIVDGGWVKRSVGYSYVGNRLSASTDNFDIANPIWLPAKDK